MPWWIVLRLQSSASWRACSSSSCNEKEKISLHSFQTLVLLLFFFRSFFLLFLYITILVWGWLSRRKDSARALSVLFFAHRVISLVDDIHCVFVAFLFSYSSVHLCNQKNQKTGKKKSFFRSVTNSTHYLFQPFDHLDHNGRRSERERERQRIFHSTRTL